MNKFLFIGLLILSTFFVFPTNLNDSSIVATNTVHPLNTKTPLVITPSTLPTQPPEQTLTPIINTSESKNNHQDTSIDTEKNLIGYQLEPWLLVLMERSFLPL
jgi:hypothetical protein